MILVFLVGCCLFFIVWLSSCFSLRIMVCRVVFIGGLRGRFCFCLVMVWVMCVLFIFRFGWFVIG